MFGEMYGHLVSQGIRTVLTACPNCTKFFRQYGHGLRVKTVYEILQYPRYTVSPGWFPGKGKGCQGSFYILAPTPPETSNDAG